VNIQESLHYYWENGLMVFTEKYHLERGYCCRNGCRHCPYGFKKKEENKQSQNQLPDDKPAK
jgi:hypothetical protein